MDHIVIPDVEKALANWRGGTAEPWAYAVSHARFALKLAKKGADSSAVLLLKNCRSVSFDAVWNDLNVRIEQRHTESSLRYIVRDGTHLNVDCGAVYISPILALYSDVGRYVESFMGVGPRGVV